MIEDKSKQYSLLIGGSSSLGTVVASEFVNQGEHVVCTYTNQVVPQKQSILSFALDITAGDSIDDFYDKMVAEGLQFKNILFLSSIILGNNMNDYVDEDIERVMTINFSGQAKLLKKIISLFTQQASILMYSSISGQRGSYDPIYAASKGAVLSFVKSMATQLPKGMRINAIAPSLVEDTSMYNDMKKDRQDFHRKMSPLGELITRENLAKISYDLCQPHWRHLNGACIDINGGVYVR